MQDHEVATLLPLMTEAEYRALVDDIRIHGQREPIWIYEGKILDGRNRFRACQELGIAPRTRQWDGHGSLVALVVSLNVQRRHLSSSQKAVIAMAVERALAAEAHQRQLATLKQNATVLQIVEKRSSPPLHAAAQAAALVGTNRQYVSDAKTIARLAPDLLPALRDGTFTIPEAKALAKLPVAQRDAARQKMRTGEARDVYQAAKLARAAARARLPLPAQLPDACTLEHRDSTAHLPTNSVDLILTDPPYGISHYRGITKIGQQLVAADFDGADDWDSADPHTFVQTVRTWGAEWARLTRPGGAVLAFTDRALVSHLWDGLKLAGLKPKNIITWVKTNSAPAGLARRNLISATEFLVWAVKPGAAYTFNEVDGWDRRNVITTCIISNSEKVDHPTQKPLAVLSPLIALTTNPGDLVLDPFAGSGSTGVAALRLGRRAHLIERSRTYVHLAAERLAAERRY